MSRTPGCNEYQSLSRRKLISSLSGLAPAWVPTVQYQDESRLGGPYGAKTRDVLLTVYLRGGMDGLTTCAPYGDANYYNLRSTIAVKPPDNADKARRATDLDGFFGLPPAMLPVQELYKNGFLAFVHGTGSTDQTRSHFDAQHFMEVGKADGRLWTGWVGRHLAMVAPTLNNAELRGMALGGQLPLILEGAPKTIAVSNLNDISYGGYNETAAKRVAWLQTAYKDADAVLSSAANTTIKTVALLQSVDFAHYQPGGGAKYIDSNGNDQYGFLTSMKASAALIKKNVGIEAINVDYGGWDTHDAMNPFDTYGQSKVLMDNLAIGLRDFFVDVDSVGMMNRVTVVVMSEFGRAAFQNGTGGTDHGHGNCMILMGRNINGGKVYRQNFSLDSSKLSLGRDLEVTIDYRKVLAEVVSKRLGNPNIGSVFPDFAPGTYLGVCK
jgi:uncharacterized protein (DUF1501 family)